MRVVWLKEHGRSSGGGAFGASYSRFVEGSRPDGAGEAAAGAAGEETA